MAILDSLYHLIKLGKEGLTAGKDLSSEGISKETINSEIENVLCFERAIRFCYASLEMMVHNRTIRHQCQNFARWSRNNEEELEKISKGTGVKEGNLVKEYQP